MTKGKLFLVPAPLGDNSPAEVIPSSVFSSIFHIRNFAVEEIRTARRYLSLIGFKGQIDLLSFYEINEHTADDNVPSVIKILLDGQDVALISEAGLPSVADPGSLLVEAAHNHDIVVIPFVGPSSLMLALMASGMNGQQFAFSGYLPVKISERKEKLKELEKRSRSRGETQIFIETPYRNDALLEDILNVCDGDTKICIAADLTLPTQMIKTKKVAEWIKTGMKIGKRPCVFLLMV